MIRPVRLCPSKLVSIARLLLEDAKRTIDVDPRYACLLLYEATKVVVKGLALFFAERDHVLDSFVRCRDPFVREWRQEDYDFVVDRLVTYVGEIVVRAWDCACYLYVNGYEEGRLDSESVRLRLSNIEELVSVAEKIVSEVKHKRD